MVKGIIKLWACLCVILVALGGCTNQVTMKSVWDEPHFSGAVVEVFDNAILVYVNYGEEIRDTSDLIYVPIDVELMHSTFMSADNVTVYFDGNIIETYPAQLSRVYAIILTSPDKSTHWHHSHRIDILHVSGSQTTERTITNRRQIDGLFHNWLVSMSLSRQPFADGESLNTSDFLATYHFTLHKAYSFTVDITGEHIDIGDHAGYFTFVYGQCRLGEWYLYYSDEWYMVNNPSSPFSNNLLTDQNYIPVNGTIISEPYLLYEAAIGIPVFTSEPLPDHIIEFITGVTFREDTPFPYSYLTYLTITHVGFDGEDRIGHMIVAAEIGDEVLEIFRDIYESHFPIHSINLIDYFDASDYLSMAANNSHAFNFRYITNANVLSRHAFGMAIDINPIQNPYIRGDNVLPAAGREYMDRTYVRPGMIVKG